MNDASGLESDADEVARRLRSLDAATQSRQPPLRLREWGSTHLGLSDPQLLDWARRAWWGIAAGELAVQWLGDRVKRSAFLALSDAPDWTEIDRARAGGGVILATAHLGPRKTAMHLCLERRWPLMVWTNLTPGDAPFLESLSAATEFANPLDASTGSVLLARTAAHLREGGLLFAAPDVASGVRTVTLQRFGATWTFSLGIPALARRLEVPVFLVLGLWREGRIRMEVKALPPPDRGLSENAWHEAWIESYWNAIEDIVTSSPENLRFLRWLFSDEEAAELIPPAEHGAGSGLAGVS